MSVTTLDGSVIPGTISGLTVHTWVADTNGLYTTSANLQSEWQSDYQIMLAGNGASLTPEQRLEGNAEAVFENTEPAAQQLTFREDAQREFDAIGAAMTINQSLYGIDPNAQFNSYTYLKMEETLQDNEELKTLGYEGHGVNDPPNSIYDGFTTDSQNRVDSKTFYVGGGTDNGEQAIANFFDDIVLTHAPFPVILHNGVEEQLNQNGNLEDTLSDVVTAANSMTYTRVLVAGDFSTVSTATGPTVSIAAEAAPALPTPAAPLAGVNSFDGSITPETISGLTAHSWTADATGLYGTLSDLATEWQADYAKMLAGQSMQMTPLQRLEGNAEAVLENTGASKLSVSSQAAFRADAQREFDAIDAAMRIDQTTYGIDPNARFTQYSYQMMQLTLQSNETLKELGYQGHGVNDPTVTKYDGFTTDFQNRTDGTTYYVGGGPGNGELAISGFFDDDILTHAPFPVVENNGTLTQLNQNGGLESPLISDVLVAANNVTYDRVYVAGDFSTNAAAVGPVVTTACYAEGTLIQTATGEIAIEDLRPGDMLVTAGGVIRPVCWTGHRSVAIARHPRPQDVQPVRVRAHAFAPGQPSRDLILSPDHAVFLGGVLIPIRYLLNGASIVQERAARVTWWHVELDTHDVILANGLPAETYLDTGNRHAFCNGGGAMMLHPEFARTAWAPKGCAELIMAGPHLAAAKQGVLAALQSDMTDEPGITVLAQGRSLTVQRDGATCHVTLPATASSVRLMSRSWVPAHMRPDENDTRRLGVALSVLRVDGRTLGLQDGRLSSGWHDAEPDWRWTDGDAGLALAGASTLSFDIAMTGRYWKRANPRRVARG